MVDVDTKGSLTAPQNSDFQEHSKNSLESAAGEAQEKVSNRGVVKRQQMRKRQEILCIKCWTDVCTQETAKIENIL